MKIRILTVLAIALTSLSGCVVAPVPQETVIVRERNILNPYYKGPRYDVIVVTNYAPGRYGYVYSPYHRGVLVDVRRYKSGQRVLCPYTGKYFIYRGPVYVAPKPAVKKSNR